MPGYTVDHSTAIIAIGPDARWRALFPAPHKRKALAADLDALMRAL